MVVDDAVARGVGLGVAEGVADGDGDGFVAAGEPHAENKARPSQTSRFISASSVARPCPAGKSPQHECARRRFLGSGVSPARNNLYGVTVKAVRELVLLPSPLVS
jgi:hypothetical protein